MTETPPVRRRLLGAALRRYREGLGYRLDDAARVLECDRSKICRIESGQRGIRARDLRDLLTEYGVGEQEQRTLAAIAQSPRARGWWEPYADVLPGGWLDYLITETAASPITTVSSGRRFSRITCYRVSIASRTRSCAPAATAGSAPMTTRAYSRVCSRSGTCCGW